MTLFLTSSPCMPDRGELNPINGFIDELKAVLKPDAKALYVAADPDDREKTEYYAQSLLNCFEASGFSFTDIQVLVWDNAEDAEQLIMDADFILLSGGHVPTQNHFFQEIGLGEILSRYQGVVMGVSAGSMNSAGEVYSSPEEPGEALDPEYQRFLPGLGLTDTQILPHYQMLKGSRLDGLLLYEEIIAGDSYGHLFYILPDGSYILQKDGQEWLLGESYTMQDGVFSPLLQNGEALQLH